MYLNSFDYNFVMHTIYLTKIKIKNGHIAKLFILIHTFSTVVTKNAVHKFLISLITLGLAYEVGKLK